METSSTVVDDRLINIAVADIKTQEPTTSVSKQYIWKSCCFQADKRVLMFTVQLLISLSVLAFAIVKLSLGEGCFYEGIIMLVIGYWLPNPKMHE